MVTPQQVTAGAVVSHCAGRDLKGPAPRLASAAQTQIVAAINEEGFEQIAWALDWRRAGLILFGVWRQARRLSYAGTILFRRA